MFYREKDFRMHSTQSGPLERISKIEILQKIFYIAIIFYSVKICYRKGEECHPKREEEKKSSKCLIFRENKKGFF